MTILQVKKLPHASDLELPQYKTEGSAGMDLVAAISNDIILKSGQSIMVETGIAIALENGYEAQIRPRSGLALKMAFLC